MAQYWEDWSDQTIDEEPTGWTKRYNTTAVVYAIKADTDAPAGKSLKVTRSSSSRRLLSWDALDSDGDRATLSIRALVRHNAPTPSGATPYLGIAGRGGGAAASETAVVGFLGSVSGGRVARIQQYNGGTSTVIEDSATGAWAVGTVYWLGLDLNGTTATVTIAPANDPDNPTVTITDTIAVTAAGWVGLFTFATGSDLDYLAIGVGTGGDPAPTEAPGGAGAELAGGAQAAASASGTLTSGSAQLAGDATVGASAAGTLAGGAAALAGDATGGALAAADLSTGSAITVVTDIDGGNVDPASVVVTDATSDTPTIYCDVRTSTKVRSWRHFLFAIESAEGKSPVFQFNLATREVAASGVAADWTPVYTTTPEDHTSWVRATSRTLVGGGSGVLEWSFDDPLPAGRIYVADLPMGRQADVEALAAELLLESYASPAASADVNGVYYTSPAATDDLSRAIGGHPMYAIKLAWPGTATTDGGPKRQLVVLTHIHAAGEACSWVPFRYWLDWVLGASSEAAAFRANWDVHLYMGLTPNGLYAGYKRQGDRGFDPNRVWAGASTLAEIEATKAAITTDLGLPGGRFDALYSWHGWLQKANAWNAYVAHPIDTDAGTRSPQMDAMISTGATIFGESLGTPTSSGTSNTDVWWARENGASVAFDTEVGQSIPSTHAFLQSVGENWGKLLQAVDAAGAFWSPTGAAFAGAAQAAVLASGSLSTAAQLAAQAIAGGQALGDLSTAITLQGAAATATLASGELSAQIRLDGAALAAAIAQAGLTTSILLAAAAQGGAQAAGSLSTGEGLEGAATGAAQATGSLTTLIVLSGAAVAALLASGDLSTTPSGLVGAATAGAQASGAITTQIPLAGGAQVSVIATGAVTTGVTLAGAAVAVVSATGDLVIALDLSAQALAAAIAGADLTTAVVLRADAVAGAQAAGALNGVTLVSAPPAYRVLPLRAENRILRPRAENRILKARVQ